MDDDAVGRHDFLAAKYTTVGVLFCLAVFFCYLPFILRRHSTRAALYLQLGQCLAAGVFITAGFLHLLPDAVSDVNPRPDDYPYVYLATLCGFVGIFLVDISLEEYAASKAGNKKARISSTSSNCSNPSDPGARGGYVSVPNGTTYAIDDTTSGDADADNECLIAEHAGSRNRGRASTNPAALQAALLSESNGSRAAPSYNTEPKMSLNNDKAPISAVLEAWANGNMFIVLALFFALSVHSLMAGFALGSTTSESLHSFAVLVIAITAHKYLAAYGLGHSVLTSGATRRDQLILFITFSLSTPIGIIIGIVADIQDNVTLGYIKAVAAGMFIFIGTIHFIDEVKDHFHDAHPLLQLLLYAIGIGAMAALALWV